MLPSTRARNLFASCVSGLLALVTRFLRPLDDVTLPDDVESKLVSRLVLRDERAFSELVHLYERRVLGLVTRMIGQQEEARELTQEVFIQVFKAIGSFRGDSKLSTWIYRIAVNSCKNRMKYLKVRHDGEQDELEAIAERVPLGQAARANVAQVDRPDEVAAGRQIERIVQASILRIEPSFREILILRDVEELSYEEIAEITNLNLGTVKSRLFRARNQLKDLVEAAMGEKVRG